MEMKENNNVIRKTMTLGELREFINTTEKEFVINVDLGELLDDKEREA